ncbi:MAG: putative metal-binding motif-containing protein [Acidobacteriota bacterium]
MKIWLGLSIIAAAAACGSDSRGPLFTPKPECKGDAVTPYQGTYPQVINSLMIGSAGDGFDLDGDGKPDNKLSTVGSLAQSAIDDSFKNYSIVIPIEFFNMAQVAASTCTKFAVYLGAYAQDKDGDGAKAAVPKGDCNDTDATIGPGMPEIPGNFKDDDCDGKVDEAADGTVPNDTADHDGDGVSIAQGDCDDTNKMIHPGLAEVCGDGLDNDCDGVADRTQDSSGTPTACNPFMPPFSTTADIPLDKLSFDTSGAPQITFTNGSIDKNLMLHAGPSLFSVNIPVQDILTLDLEITGATIEAQMNADGSIAKARLGGIISARTADQITGLKVDQIGLLPQDSLLDAVFANVLGDLLALPKSKSAKVQQMYPGCKTPDIDVDGDGLEAFCQSDPTATDKVADVCIDGDGTIVMSTYDANGKIVDHCAQAVDKAGKPRFVDGISVELNFTTTLIHAIKPPAP